MARVHRELSIDDRAADHRGDRERSVAGGRGEEKKGTESAGGFIEGYRCIIFQRVPLPSPFLSSRLLASSLRRPSLPLSFCLLRHEEHRTTPRTGYKISRVYAGWIRLAWP